MICVKMATGIYFLDPFTPPYMQVASQWFQQFYQSTHLGEILNRFQREIVYKWSIKYHILINVWLYYMTQGTIMLTTFNIFSYLYINVSDITMIKQSYISTLSTLIPHASVASSRLACKINNELCSNQKYQNDNNY